MQKLLIKYLSVGNISLLNELPDDSSLNINCGIFFPIKGDLIFLVSINKPNKNISINDKKSIKINLFFKLFHFII